MTDAQDFDLAELRQFFLTEALSVLLHVHTSTRYPIHSSMISKAKPNRAGTARQGGRI